MRYAIFLLFALFGFSTEAAQFNVYLRYNDSDLHAYLQELNTFLDQRGLLSKYQIKPFLDDYPLHTTLYLTDYESESIPYVMDVLKKTAEHWSQFQIKTSDFIVTPQGYVMLNLAYEPKPSGYNPVIQAYSDELVFKLMGYRDTHATIPDWARNNPVKLKAYQRYGSPNVFFEFSPHFTLMAKKFKDKQKADDFVREMTEAINEYQIGHDPKIIQLTATDLGIGYANEYGQVTREIMTFSLGRK